MYTFPTNPVHVKGVSRFFFGILFGSNNFERDGSVYSINNKLSEKFKKRQLFTNSGSVRRDLSDETRTTLMPKPFTERLCFMELARLGSVSSLRAIEARRSVFDRLSTFARLEANSTIFCWLQGSNWSTRFLKTTTPVFWCLEDS